MIERLFGGNYQHYVCQALNTRFIRNPAHLLLTTVGTGEECMYSTVFISGVEGKTGKPYL